MKKSLKKLLLLMCVLLAVVAFAGCKKKGPMEQAGEAVDKAAQKTSDAVKEAADDTKDAVEEAVDDTKDAVKDK
jgi:predicted small lipoprotein YifL